MGRSVIHRKVKNLRLVEAGADHNLPGQDHPSSELHHVREVAPRKPTAAEIRARLEAEVRARFDAQLRARIDAEVEKRLAAELKALEDGDDGEEA